MLYLLYRFYAIIIQPFLLFYLHYRLRRRLEDGKRYKEKLGITNEVRPDGMLLWFHAEDIDSVYSVIAVLRYFHQEFPDYNYLVTTKTLPIFSIIQKAKLANTIHQYYPFDTHDISLRFLSHWRPNIAIFTHSNMCFNILLALRDIQCPIVLMHVEFSDYAFWKRWFFRGTFFRYISFFSIILAKTPLDQHKFSYFISDNLYYIGKIKNTYPPIPHNEDMLDMLRQKIANRQVLLLANTHRREEEEGLLAAALIKSQIKDVLVIIVPRNKNRVKEIEKIIQKHGMKYISHLKNFANITNDTDVYLVDTIGELGLFYTLADCVFIGGSLVKHGGHNVLEPAKFNCAIMTGPYTFYFTEVVQNLVSCNALTIVKNKDELADACIALFKNRELMNGMKAKAYAGYERQKVILKQTVLYINSLLS